MQNIIEKAEVLLEAIPYIRKFRESIIVVKYGGSAMVSDELRKSVVCDIAMLKYLGLNPIVVHGGGKDISSMLKKIGKESNFIDGLRVSDKETVQIAEMVLSGSISKALVQDLENEGISAVSINGKDGHTLKAKKKEYLNKDLGYVGEIEKVNPDLIKSLLKSGYVPVISPIAYSKIGETYNINADYCASAIAGALKAQKLVFLSDVEGILKNKDDSSSRIAQLTKDKALKYIDEKIINGGMIPKVQCCLKAIDDGVKSVHVLDGRVPHSILLEIFTNKGIGTMVIK